MLGREVGTEAMYSQSAEWYDSFFKGKDYAGQAEQVLSLIEEQGGAPSTLLDVAGGTGRHLAHFAERLDCWVSTSIPVCSKSPSGAVRA